ncbi:MAG: hypothetical protein QOH04_2597 [Sphingomonadales bacterium]|jgi:hypothetical protein|nr:hypothetical protein [Sphingomonadales bacterium]
MTLLDHFAERLSLHGDAARAAAQLGRSRAWGGAMLRKLRQDLGSQAA